MPRDGYVAVAGENEAIIGAGGYAAPGGGWVSLGAAVSAACSGTRSYGPGDTAGLVDVVCGGAALGLGLSCRVEVTGESSMGAAWRLVGEGASDVAVLNFASARNPGGGYLRGARAQEEDLCRVSALYTTLLSAPDYYAAHRASGDPFYSHRVIYSPDVPVFRTEDYVLVDRPVGVGFLTSPAPNAGVIAQSCPSRVADVPTVLAERAARVLAVALLHGRRSLVLGAWGCGVFRNDPGVVARAFDALLAGPFAGRFARVVFAVLDRPPAVNLQAFRSTFAGG